MIVIFVICIEGRLHLFHSMPATRSQRVEICIFPVSPVFSAVDKSSNSK